MAVTGHAKRPLIVSAGLDGFVIVWDPNIANAQGSARDLAQPAPPGPGPRGGLHAARRAGRARRHRRQRRQGPHLGPHRPGEAAERAQVRPGRLPHRGSDRDHRQPGREVRRYAAGREVFIWDILNGKRLYSLPPEHRDSVTSLAFTPQGTLITAAKDRTLKVWKLGTEKAAVDADRRTPLRRWSILSASARTAGGCCSTRTRAASTS